MEFPEILKLVAGDCIDFRPADLKFYKVKVVRVSKLRSLEHPTVG